MTKTFEELVALAVKILKAKSNTDRVSAQDQFEKGFSGSTFNRRDVFRKAVKELAKE